MTASTKGWIRRLFVLVTVIGAQAGAQESMPATGIWEAQMPFGPASIRLRLEIEQSDDRLDGRIVNATQEETAFPIDRLTIDRRAVFVQSCTLQFNPFQVVIGATYEGTLSDDSSEIRGTLSQAGVRIPVIFRRTRSLDSNERAGSSSERIPGRVGGLAQCSHPARVAAERFLERFPALIQRGDRREFRTFVSESFPPDTLGPVAAAPGTLLETWVDRFSAFHHASHGYELQEMQDVGTNWVTTLLRNRLTSDLTRITLVTDVESPHRILIARFVPVLPSVPNSARMSSRQVVRAVEAYAQRLADADVFSGALLLAKDGEVVFEEAYGMASKNFRLPNTLDTRFDLGSMPKMFTAVAVMQLVEARRLSLDDPLSKFLPGFPDEAAAGRIHIEHLLTHTAGLGDYRSQRFPETSKDVYRSVDDYMRLAAVETLQFEPGTRVQYSNTGFLVLGKVIEVVTGIDYFDYIREHIFEPAGMSETGAYPPGRTDGNVAIGYDRQYTDSGIVYAAVPQPEFRVGSPAGGSPSTVHDILKFANALLAKKLVSAESLERMFSPNPDLNANYGLGFEASTEFPRAGHSGGSRGHYSNLDMFLDSGWTAIVLSNYSEGSVPAYPSIIGKIRELLGACNEPPNPFRLCVR